MKKNLVSALKRIGGTLMLPVLMYLAMMWLCYANGKMYFGTYKMWRTLIVDIAISISCAMGIGLQFKNGRFDFSGGAIMLLSAIIAGNVAKNMGNNLPVMVVLCVVCCVGLSLLVALFYAVFTPASTWLGNWLEGLGVHDWLVQLIVMCTNLVTEYLFQKFVVYREKKEN